jgi:hypothetical protein
MTRKTVQVLVVTIVALVLLLLVLDRDSDDVSADREVLLPGFKETANDATRINISGSGGGDYVSMRREEGNWVVSERDGYAADVSELGQLISALANARVVEEKTSNPANYAKLGVDDPGDGGNGQLVVISGADFSYSIILGDTAQGAFRYARIPDEATSYLIDQDPSIPDSAGDWLRPGIIDIPSSRIRRVSVAHADGETIVIEKTDEEQTDFVVLDVPEGRELSYATVGNGMADGLAGLELDDVRKQVDAQASTSVDFDTWDGLRLNVEVVSEDETTLLAFSATTTDEESTAENEVVEINQRLAGWQYEVADYKKNLLARRWSDILKSANED